jgi:hypothetical protein
MMEILKGVSKRFWSAAARAAVASGSRASAAEPRVAPAIVLEKFRRFMVGLQAFLYHPAGHLGMWQTKHLAHDGQRRAAQAYASVVLLTTGFLPPDSCHRQVLT